jgi:transposase
MDFTQWVCSECGSVHDRDGNAAINIARLGREALGPQ